jgi:hypothetical protein
VQSPTISPDPSVVAQQTQSAAKQQQQIQQNVGADTANLLRMFGQTTASQSAGLMASPVVGGGVVATQPAGLSGLLGRS